MVVCRIALWALALVAAAGDSLAQKFPARPVRLIVPFASGGSRDFIARMVGQKLAEAWGQQVAKVRRNKGKRSFIERIIAEYPNSLRRRAS